MREIGLINQNIRPTWGSFLLLLTNCEVHTPKYPDAVLTYGPNEMRSVQKLSSEYFPYGTNNWLIRALLYSDHNVVGKFSEN